ncbi:NAD(P)-dependent oxidoreductase [Actinocrinis puniceicyclus]|uniref:NAD(P)-dependent oxidoreductase n=1 Tax=Actinocrinis puniceicyclus TaxID=977794 RepID=A0A8J7WG01_9ACTN|nr:NAD(P)-dependent oxidoreductase [Actinocrinis puniceicyclus]MBS2961481.1 NAD(P)-dependent oxidoreductase [Actinocrinis puniceicyclus]
MARVTVLGTGLMGSGIARSLARGGHQVTAWNRSPDKALDLADAGVETAGDPAAAVRGAHVALTMLFDADAVEDVMKPALPAMDADAVWLQCATVGLDATARLARLADRHDVGFVDAPVLGTRQPAEQGKLIVLAAGPVGLRERVAPVLDAIGSRTVWVGERPGQGHRVKLAANSWVLSLIGATAQGVALTRQLGLDPALFLQTIAGGPLDCEYAQSKGKAMIAGDFAPAFTLGGAAKDAALIIEAMQAAGCDDRLMQALRAQFDAADQAGHGADDIAAVVRAFS